MTVESSFGPSPLPTYSEPEAVILSSPNEGNSDIKAFDDSDGPSFSDLLDVINPLQHIPIINTIYRELTGDKEGAVADVVGGALWGGLIGLGAAVANLVIEDSTGKTIDGHVMALFSDDTGDTAVAKAKGAADQTASAQAPASGGAPLPQAAEPIKIFSLGDTAQTPATGDAPAGGGPIVRGDFMVFGAATGPAASSSFSPAAAATTTTTASTVSTASTAAAAKTVAETSNGKGEADKNAAGSTRSGDFMVFGAGQPAANDLPASTPVAASAPTSLTPAPERADKAMSDTNQTAALASPPARSFAIPTQRNTVTPPQVLPMPTTGPAAVPGNARAISAARSGDQTGSAWFVGAFNQAMDKYNRAAGLGTTAGSTQKPADGETANSVLQMN